MTLGANPPTARSLTPAAGRERAAEGRESPPGCDSEAMFG